MDLNLFATQIIQSNGKGSAAVLGNGGLLGGAGGLGAISMDFWNVILGNIEDEKGLANADDKSLTPEQSSKAIKKETADLALLQLALLGQDPDVNIDEKLAELRIERLSQSKQNRVEQLTKLIEHLTSGLPEATTENTNIEELVTRLTKRLETLQASLDAFRTGDFGDEGAPFKLLIATGLNPAQITKITNRIEEVETKLGRELTVEDLIAGVGNIIPAPGDDEDHELSTTDALEILIDQTTTDEKQEDISLKNDNIGSTNAENVTSLEKKAKRRNNEGDDAINFVGINQVLHTLRSHTKYGLSTAEIAKPTGTNTTTNAETNNLKPGLIADEGIALPTQRTNSEFNELFQATNAAKRVLAKLNVSNFSEKASLPAQARLGDITLPTNWNETFSARAILSEALGYDIDTGTPFNTTMMAAHSAASISQAGQTHQATQMVAAHISRAAQTGETKNITLHLDPQELGRVEVRLEFGKDKSVKAHLIVEKPETLLMLQRDASSLERALQNAGLDTDAGSLNFQMADDGYAFNPNSQNQGQNTNGSNSGTKNALDNTDDQNIIETTLTWDIDPETGHTRYSLLA